MKTNFTLKIGFLLTIAALSYACKNRKTEKNLDQLPVPVKIIALGQQTDQTKAIAYSGTITANKTIDLSFQASGTVEQIPVELGQYVKKGQLIARIDETIYRNQYQAQQAQATLAKENYERINQVYQKGSIAEIKMLEARSQYQQAQAAVNAAAQNLSHTRIYAPSNGYIGNKLIEAGNTAGPGVPVVQLLDISTVKAIVPIPDLEIDKIKKGTPVTVQIPSLENQSYSGLIDEIAIAAGQGAPTYSAKVLLKNTDNRLKPGMVANVSFQKPPSNPGTGNQQPAVIIPLQTIQVDENGHQFVFTTSKDGKRAVRTPVQTGALYDEGIAIKSGLSGGEQLISSGYHKLADSSLIQIVK